MNFASLNFEHVEPRARPLLPPHSIHPSPTHDHAAYASNKATPSAPTPHLQSSSSSPSREEIYGPDRHPRVAADLSRPLRVSGVGTGRFPALQQLTALERDQVDRLVDMDADVHAAMMPDFRDPVARQARMVTPGVDDTPYIQYAIEALTGASGRSYASDSSEGSRVPLMAAQHAPAPEPMPVPVPVAPVTRPSAVHPSPIQQKEPFFMKLAAFQMPGYMPAQTEEDVFEPVDIPRATQPNEWLPVDRDLVTDPALVAQLKGYGSLNYRPWLLRGPALALLMVLCVLMLAALLSLAIYSHLHTGITEYGHGGAYFVFRILPQLLGAVVLVYAQCVMSTMIRILPFVRLASRHMSHRELGLFQDLYSTSFLWPQLTGRWHGWVPVLVTWLINFTIPLESALFSVVFVDGVWIWATVQGVAWTLVALYLALLVSTALVWRYWSQTTRTGLLWDPRALADIIVMLSDTNVAPDYHGTQMAGTRDTLRFRLRRRADDRLGYWAWKDGRPGFWYALGNTMDESNFVPVPDNIKGLEMLGDKEKHAAAAGLGLLEADHDVESLARSPAIRYRYLPWCLRTSQLLYLAVGSFVLLVALFVVSFLPSTRITAGFLPSLSAAPGPGAFSAANFLYSFLPSFLGMILYLSFQSLDQALRILQPWAALAELGGAPASASLLADYAAALPLQSTFHALRSGHLRLAAISLLATLLLLVPILAGGVFMALTTPDGQVRMFPNVPAYALLLTLLVLYFVGVASLLPRRRALRLPHAVTCLAEITSFVANEDLLADEAFKVCRTRAELRTKMGATIVPVSRQPAWALGYGAAAAGVLGVRRVKRFTEKRAVRKSQIRRGKRPPRGTVQMGE